MNWKSKLAYPALAGGVGFLFCKIYWMIFDASPVNAGLFACIIIVPLAANAVTEIVRWLDKVSR